MDFVYVVIIEDESANFDWHKDVFILGVYTNKEKALEIGKKCEDIYESVYVKQVPLNTERFAYICSYQYE